MSDSRSPSRERDDRRRKQTSRSPSRDNAITEKDEMQVDEDRVTRISVTDEDIAFVLGSHGKTKRKISRVTGARITIDEKRLEIEIAGSTEEQKRAEEFVRLVMSQRGGSVYLDLDAKRDDMTIIDVPRDAVGYITGTRGVVLRAVEEEWNTIMFFVTHKPANAKDEDASMETEKRGNKDEKLAIFGSDRGRCGSCLKFLSSIEYKIPGHVLNDDGTLKVDIDILPNTQSDDYGMEYQRLVGEDFSYALGNNGSTRKKIARAANCILEYISDVAYFVGTSKERERCKDYLKWLISQRSGIVHVDFESRDDATYVEVEQAYVGFITGARGATLRRIEMDTDTFCFSDGDRNDRSKEKGRILIFSHSKENRERAKRAILNKRDEKMRMDSRGYSDRRGRDRHGGGRFGDRNRRGRSNPRRRRRSYSPIRGRRPRSRRRSPPRNRRGRW